MVGNVDDNHAGKSGHEMKVSEPTQPTNKVLLVFGCFGRLIPRLGKKTGVRPVCPRITGEEWPFSSSE
jgi:hypothetical protein